MATNALVARFLNHWNKWAGGIVILAVVGIVVGIIFATFHYRLALAKWLEYTMVMGNSVISPGTRVFRDAMVALAAVIGIAIAVWRGVMLDRQTKTGEERLLRERFATAAELMAKEIAGKPAIAARVSGIYIMEELASDAPKHFLRQTIKNMVSYIKDNAQITAMPDKEQYILNPGKPRVLGEDVKTAFAVITGLCVKCEGGGVPQALCLELADDLDFSGVDFSRLDLSHNYIRGLRWFEWGNANLSGANLFGANLRNANLANAILNGANLQQAIFTGAHLAGAGLTEADLSGAQMQGAVLTNADLRGANLTRTELEGARLDSAKMQGADLSRAQLNKNFSNNRCAILRDARLEGANLENAELRDADLQSAYLYGVNLNADLRGANLKWAKFGETYMPEVDFEPGKELPREVKEAMDGKIWYSIVIDPWREGIQERPENDEWDLDRYKDPYALAGILRNFAKSGVFRPGIVLRKQARQLLDDGKLPQGMPEELVEWLKGVDLETGKHADGK